MAGSMCPSFLGASEPLTRVDTEHGFAGKLKAIRSGFWHFFRGGLLARRGRERTAAAEAEQAGGEDASDGAGALLGGQGRGVVGRSHGESPWDTAHSDLRLATGRLSGGMRDALPLPVKYPARVRGDERGASGTVVLTRWAAVG